MDEVLRNPRVLGFVAKALTLLSTAETHAGSFPPPGPLHGSVVAVPPGQPVLDPYCLPLGLRRALARPATVLDHPLDPTRNYSTGLPAAAPTDLRPQLTPACPATVLGHLLEHTRNCSSGLPATAPSGGPPFPSGLLEPWPPPTGPLCAPGCPF